MGRQRTSRKYGRGRRFARAEPRWRVLTYLRGLLGNVGRKRRDRVPEVGHDLGRGAAPVFGHSRQGGQLPAGVFLTYASARGRAFIDRELYLPKAWTEDRVRCRAARVPEQVGFRTKPQLARVMLGRALDAGMPDCWVTDEVDGQDPALRVWLEGRRMACVLAIKCSELLAVGAGPAKLSAAELAVAVPAEHWVGQRRPRRQKATAVRLDLNPADPTSRQRMAAVAAGPAQPPRRRAGRLRLLRARENLIGRAGSGGRDPVGIEDVFRQAKNEVTWTTTRSGSGRAGIGTSPWPYSPMPSWSSPAPRPPSATAQRGTRRPDRRLGLLPLTVPEVRHLLVALVWTAPVQPGLGAGLVTLAPTPSGPSATRTPQR
jgi:DDE superfamily endonuclease